LFCKNQWVTPLISLIRSATNGNYALGSERIQKEIEAALRRRARRGIAGRSSHNPNDETNQLGFLQHPPEGN